MNDIPYDELFADLFEADTTYQEASTQVRCGLSDPRHLIPLESAAIC
jgi:hypothetical protein